MEINLCEEKKQIHHCLGMKVDEWLDHKGAQEDYCGWWKILLSELVTWVIILIYSYTHETHEYIHISRFTKL